MLLRAGAMVPCPQCASSSPTSRLPARPTATAPIASTSTAAFSTTASVSGASPAELRLRAHRKRLRDRKAVTDAELARTKPDPILGYPTNMKTGHHTWENCELAKLILSRDDVWSGKAAEIVSGQLGKQGQESLTEGDADRPTLFNFGLTAEDASVLLDRLPAVSAQRSLFSSTGRDRSLAFQGGLEARMEQSEATERTKAEAVARVVDLRNADSKGIEKFNIARIVDAFSRSHRPGPDDPPRVSATPVKRDVGCPEVQGTPSSSFRSVCSPC